MASSAYKSVTDLIDQAAYDEGCWLAGLQGLADLTCSARAQLIGIGGPGAIPYNLVTDLPERALEDFAAIRGESAAVNWRVAAAAKAAPMEVVWERNYRAARAGMDAEIYDAFSERYEMPHGCQTTLVAGEGGLIGLAILRSKRDGATAAAERNAFAVVARHARQAVWTATLLKRQGAALVAGSLEAMTAAAFVCDGFGMVRAMTPAAEQELFEVGTPLVLKNGRLHGRRNADDTVIETALGRAIGTQDVAGASSTVRLGRPDQPVMLSALPLPGRDWALPVAPRAIIVVRRARRLREDAAALLASLYGLSAAEAATAAMFLAGMRREQIAGARGVSLSTVRSQMKDIFRKVGVSREAELAIIMTEALATLRD